MVLSSTVEKTPVCTVILSAYLCRLDSVLFGDETLLLIGGRTAGFVDSKVQDYTHFYKKINKSKAFRRSPGCKTVLVSDLTGIPSMSGSAAGGSGSSPRCERHKLCAQ